MATKSKKMSTTKSKATAHARANERSSGLMAERKCDLGD